MAFRRDEQGASAPFQFVIAGALIVGVIGTVLLTTQDQVSETAGSTEESMRLDAQALVDMLTGRPGQGWEGGADTVTQLGLLNDNRTGLNSDHIAAMEGASYESSANGLLDYPEAQAALGLEADGEQDFHVRISPIGLQSVLSEDLSHLETAYIADWTQLGCYDVSLSLDDLTMVADARQAIAADATPGALTEMQLLADLGLAYDGEVHISLDRPCVTILETGLDLQLTITDQGLLEGDVYPDDKQYLDDILAGRLVNYEILVVGSTIDHSSLTSDVTKDAIAQWVLDGGILIVLGSDSQNFQWLQPLFSVGTTTVNGGAYTPDVDHPILREPHQLSWTAYDNHGLGWDLKDQGSGANYDSFQHVIIEDGEDLLAISLDGAFGDGRVFLSTFRPSEIADELGLTEASNFINNIVVYADRDELYLDYGPSPPQDRSVAAATRFSHIWDPDLGQVPVSVTVLFWDK